MTNETAVSVIGLGKLGGPIAVSIASRGFSVTGVDLSQDFVDNINNVHTYLQEPDFADYLIKYQKYIKASTNYREAIEKSVITFVVVPTPSLPDGSFSNKYLLSSIQEIGKALKSKSNFHLIAVVSTVSPQSIYSQILPELQKYSGKICGRDFGLCYNPSFVSLGNVIRNFLHPDFILIGESDDQSGKILTEFYKKLLPKTLQFQRMNIINAEITKIALNTYITTKISYANMLAELCENLPGADVDAVTNALGCDSRIGRKYLTGGTAYGGPCFPRDNWALTAAAKKAHVKLYLPGVTDKINFQQIKRIVKIVRRNIPKRANVTILGLAYRPDTDVVDESTGMRLTLELLHFNYKITLYDPLALVNARKKLENRVTYAGNIKDSLEKARGIILTTPWPEFAKINPNLLNHQSLFILDCWRIMKNIKFPDSVKYYALGVNKLNE